MAGTSQDGYFHVLTLKRAFLSLVLGNRVPGLSSPI